MSCLTHTLRDEPAILDRLPWDQPWAPWTLHWKVEVTADGELLWVRPYRTHREAVRAYYKLVGLRLIGRERFLITMRSVATFNATNSDATKTWNSGGCLSPNGVTSVDWMMIAGGGCGGSTDGATSLRGGGGGAGGYLNGIGKVVTPNTNYLIVVGTGGTTSNGANSEFGGVVCTGGGRGGTNGANNGLGGGCGGGGGTDATSPVGQKNFPGGAGTAGQGRNGGSGNWDQSPGGDIGRVGGGGGGASTVGSNGVPGGGGGLGGDGATSSISGVSVSLGGGGNGARSPFTPSYGGGKAGNTEGASGVAGVKNTGGGGGGGAGNGATSGGAGGDGQLVLAFFGGTAFLNLPQG